MENNLRINHIAVWICIVLLFVLGFLWYGSLFGEQWMAMVGLDMETVQNNPPSTGTWITNTIATIIPVYVLAWLFTKLGVDSLAKGAMIGLLIAFAFNFMGTMAGNMFAQAPYGLTWITGGFELVSMTLTGAILGAWTKKLTKAIGVFIVITFLTCNLLSTI